MGALARRRALTGRLRFIMRPLRSTLELPSLRHDWRAAAILLLPTLALFALGYLLPFGNLVIQSMTRDGAFSLANYAEQLSSPAFGIIVLRTVRLAAIVTVLCLVIGFPLAYALSRLAPRRAAALLVLVTVPYLTSILIRTYAWIVVLSPSGIVNRLLIGSGLIDEPLQLVFNQLGVYVGMVQVQLPLMIFPLYAAMHRIDRSLVAAAQSLGSSPAGAFWHITVPLSMPGVISGSILVFLSCLGFYVTPALLGGTGEYMVAQGISIRVTTLADFDAASAQATLLLVAIGVIFLVLRRQIAAAMGEDGASHGRSNPNIGGFGSQPRDECHTGLRFWPTALEAAAATLTPALRRFGVILSNVRRPLIWIAAATCLAILVLPLLVVVPLAFSSGAYLTFPPPGYSLRWFRTFFTNAQWLDATWFSVRMALLGAGASIVLGVPAAFALTRGRLAGRLAFYLLFISPLVLPHIVMAVALYFQIAKVGLIGTSAAFVTAYALIGVPYVIVMFMAGLRRLDPSYERAAASLGGSPLTVLRTVTLPLLAPTLASALFFSFIVGFDDVVFGMFLSGPGATPLPIRMWDDIRLEISPQIAVVAVLLFMILAVLYAIQLAVSAVFARGGKSRPIL